MGNGFRGRREARLIVLGIHFGHGAAAALIVDGRVEAAIEEEKLNRTKGYVGFPFMATNYVLAQKGWRQTMLTA